MKATQTRTEPDRRVEILVQRLRPDIRKILARQAIPEDDAEDLLQDTLIALVFKLDQIRNPAAWFLATLQNRCRIYWRSRNDDLFEAVDDAILESLAGPQEPPQERAEIRHDLNVALSRLPERYRDVLRLRYGLGCKSSEIAAQLGYESEGMRRLTSQSLVSLTRELRKIGLTRDNVRG